MITFPNAKINLGLNVVKKRSDGYHNIETVFYPIGLCDALEVITSTKFKFELSGIRLDGISENNLVVKAYRLLKEEFQLPPVKIHLHKVIPIGAGLGGGSSDGAFMLKLLNNLFKLGIETQQLEKYASLLGADCPFFIKNAPAFGSGIGDVLKSINIDLSDFLIILIKPPFSVNTAGAYKNIHPTVPTNSINNILLLDISEWERVLKNDFEKPVFQMYPEIERIKEKLYEQGALYASMTGSGSSVFGIFPRIAINPVIFFPKDYFVYR
jgi:4-diphosphocytidyl-2-C-methyl-D-erythritol kinase